MGAIARRVRRAACASLGTRTSRPGHASAPRRNEGVMSKGTFAAIALAALVASGSIAHAQDPAALVEDVNSKTAGVDFMDYVAAGKVIRLQAGDQLVLGYLRSCWRETITGGTVTIGPEQSEVAGGTVRRQKMQCDGGRLRLTQQQAAQSGAMAFRGPAATQRPADQPQLTLYGVAPLVDLAGGGRVSFERIDQPGQRVDVDLGPSLRVRGNIYDLAKGGPSLQPGGIYRARAGEKQVVLRVDANAAPGASPSVGRLLRF